MRPYNRIPIWENRKRVQFLSEFRKLLAQYFTDTEPIGMGLRLHEGAIAQGLRQEINHKLLTAIQIVRSTGSSSELLLQDPIMIGGRRHDIELFSNVFRLSELQIDRRYLFDVLDVAIGVYSTDERMALIRTFNPLYWLWSGFEWIAEIPFRFLQGLGLISPRASSSLIGRLIRGVILLAEGAAAILTILQFLGLLRS